MPSSNHWSAYRKKYTSFRKDRRCSYLYIVLGTECNMMETSTWYLMIHQVICSILSKSWKIFAILAKANVTCGLYMTCAKVILLAIQVWRLKGKRKNSILKEVWSWSWSFKCHISHCTQLIRVMESKPTPQCHHSCSNDCNLSKLTILSIYLTAHKSEEFLGQSWNII